MLEDRSYFRADLHCHSNCSDGSDSPIQLLEKASSLNLQGLSITDHDTIAAYTPELFQRAADLQIEILPGVELSTELDGVVVHILGYGFDLKSIELRQLLDEIQTFRVKRNRAILDKLKAKNMIITEEELLSLGDQRSIGRPHIAQLLLKKGYVFSFAQAFEMYLKDGASCYVSGFKITPAEAIAKIHEANGKAILAHPHFIKEQRILKKLLGLPFDGIECYYAMLSKTQEASWIALAKQKRWIATGGSDYHGTYKPYISLGASWVDWTTLQALL